MHTLDNNFSVYYLDTVESILDRYAASKNTLTNYIYFQDGLPSFIDLNKSDRRLKVNNLVEEMERLNTVDEVVMYFKDKLSQRNLTWKDVFTKYVLYNKMLLSIESSDNIPFAIMTVDKYMADILKHPYLEDMIDDKFDLSEVYKERDRYRTEIANDIIRLKNQTTCVVKLYEQFESIGVHSEFTEFVIDKVTYKVVLDMDTNVLADIFNYIILDETKVPFATLNNFFKISNNFIPSLEWGENLVQDSISIRVLNKKDISSTNLVNYNEIVITVDEGVIVVHLNLHVSNSNVSSMILMDRVLGALDKDNIMVGEYIENKVKGDYLIPNRSMNIKVMADLVMNNPLFSSMMYIDESTKASNLKTGLYINVIHPRFGNIGVNIIERVVDFSQNISIEADFPVGSTYLNIRVSKALNVSKVREFQLLFARLLIIYDQEIDTLVSTYQMYIPSFVVKKVTQPVKEKDENVSTLKKLEPDLFKPPYATSCQKNRQPSIVTDEEAQKLEEAGRNILRFPREGDGNVIRNYACLGDEYKFPELQTNKILHNKVAFPYLPCCWKSEKSKIEGTPHYNYYEGLEMIEKVDASTTAIYKDGKVVPPGKNGDLPLDIKNMFNLLEVNTEYRYMRRGMFDTPSSFLNCVVYALTSLSVDCLHGNWFLDYLKIHNIPTVESEANEYLKNIRELLATPELSSLCRQEIYDKTSVEIQDEILNPDIYMDPRRMVAMLEEVSNCNIIILSKNDITSQMELPRFSQSYYKKYRDGPCIIIFEHLGGRTTSSSYPYCELVYKNEIADDNNNKYIFTNDLYITKELKMIYNKMMKSYILNNELLFTPNLEIEHPLKLVGQGIDSYGKCRMLKIEYNGVESSLITPPLQPYAVREIPWTDEIETSIQNAYAIATILRLENIVEEGNKLICTFEGVYIYIPLIKSAYVEVNSKLDNYYNPSKKLARYTVEYMIWLYSKYIGGDEYSMSDKSIIGFRKALITVDSSFRYSMDIDKTFSMESTFMRNNKLVVRSNEVLKRLLYLLRVESIRHKDKVLNYRNRKELENFYQDINDFDKHSSQIILYGENSIHKWINDCDNRKHNLHKTIMINIAIKGGENIVFDCENEFEKWLSESDSPYTIIPGKPYFFNNKLVGEGNYIAQNTDSIGNALYIAASWEAKKFNVTSRTLKENMRGFTLYTYVNSCNIKHTLVKGNPQSDFQIMGYKIDQRNEVLTAIPNRVDTVTKSFFTVLMPL
jgi:hypothetical protein